METIVIPNNRFQRLLIVAISFLCGCQPLNVNDTIKSSSSTTVVNKLDANEIRHIIRSGRVYVRPNFLSDDQITFLTQDIQRLQKEGNFEKSGLSNTIKGSAQGFGRHDRAVCPVPWWKESLHQPSNNGDLDGNNPVAQPLSDLRTFLSATLDRPTMLDPTLQHECYYSVSGAGSTLSRHMDERHEELKGPKGWLLPSRRSLSWLVYLSDESDWTLERNGGGLRTFPQRQLQLSAESLQRHDTATHNGNLAIGYLNEMVDDKGGVVSVSNPVYLDSWYLPDARAADAGDYHHILYTIHSEDNMGKPQYLTHPWRPEDLPPGMPLADFIKALAQRDSTTQQQQQQASDSSSPLFLRPRDAKCFILLEDRVSWDDEAKRPPAGSETVDICPSRGTLVVFDSVLLPHQVEAVKAGNRIALAGWFHERTQSIPGFDPQA